MNKEFDFSMAKKPHEVSGLQQLQQAHQKSIQHTASGLLYDYILNWLSQQNAGVQKRVNIILRQVMELLTE